MRKAGWEEEEGREAKGVSYLCPSGTRSTFSPKGGRAESPFPWGEVWFLCPLPRRVRWEEGTRLWGH